MGSQENLQAVKDIYTAFDRGEIDAIIDVLADDVEWGCTTVATEVPWLGVVTGRGNVREQFFDPIPEHAEMHLFERDEFAASDNHVAVTWRGEFTVKRTGDKVSARGMHFWTFGPDGKVTRYQHFTDTAAELAAWRG
jgi:hypothetical protein